MARIYEQVEWFYSFDTWPGETYGVLDMGEHWSILRQIEEPNGGAEVTVLGRAPDRKTAIGFIKLLVNKE